MSGPESVIELLHKLAYRDLFVMSLVELLRDEGKHDKMPIRLANLIKGAPVAEVYRVLERLSGLGAIEYIEIGNYGVTPAGVAALRYSNEYWVPSGTEENRRQRKIETPGRD